MSLRVVVTDTETGHEQAAELPPGEYVLICADPCYRAHVTAHANGTHVITVKGHRSAGKVGAS